MILIEKLDLDGMFKMAFRLSDKLVLMMLGSLFEDDYTGKEVTVEYGNTEFIGDRLERFHSQCGNHNQRRKFNPQLPY